ncbi:crotonase/enoyl-CoA hydratase family protein [soil metagenome]
MTDELLVEVGAGVMTITINRPEQRNAMTLEVAEAIAGALDELDSRDDLVVGVFTGAGGTFCAGMDLKRFAQGERPAIPGRGFGGFTERPPKKPLIAAVEGWALGGGFELMLACDLAVAGETARFGTPEVRRGLIARGGGLIRLARRIPQAIALEMVLTGAPITAARAAAVGLVNDVVAEGEALARARELAAVIASNAPLAVKVSKAVVLESLDWRTDEAFERQVPYADVVFASADAVEGSRAFAERRDPKWTGR